MNPLYLEALLVAIKLLTPDRQARLEGKHHNLLMALRKAQRAGKAAYTDDAVIEAEEDIQDFLAAFKSEAISQGEASK